VARFGAETGIKVEYESFEGEQAFAERLAQGGPGSTS